jgi:hypothetical protein
MTEQDPDPRTAPEDGEDATPKPAPLSDASNDGQSAQAPAEGDDSAAPETDGSPPG